MNLKNLLDLSDDIFKTLTEQSTLGISVSDLKGNYLFANNALSIMTGYTKPELLSMNNSNLLETELIQVEHEVINQCTNDTGKQKNAQFLIRRNDNSLFTALIISKTINLGGASCILATIQDISEEVIKNNETKKKEHFNNIIREVSNDGIWDWNLTESIIDFDERYYTMAGYQRGDLSNRISEWYKKIHRNDVANVISQFKAYMAGEIKNYDVEFRFKCKNNNYIWIRQRGKIIEVDENNKPLRFVGTHSDINMQKEYENEIILQAHFDSLTFLPNRFLSLDRLTVACEDAKRKKTLVALLFLDLDDFKKITRLALSDPLTGLANRNKFETGINEMVVLANREEKNIALLALDLDKFKPINDEYGHAAGDLILKAVANNLLLIFRETDLVARLGGDEFSVVLYAADDLEMIKKTLQRVIALIPTSVPYGKDKLSVGVSIGVALQPHNANFDLDILMNNADMALYQAKEGGRNTYRIFNE